MRNRQFVFAPKIEYQLAAERPVVSNVEPSEANLQNLQFPYCTKNYLGESRRKSEEIRELLTLLGSNLSIKQGKLSVSLALPLVLIQKMAPEVKRISEAIGPAKNVDDIRVLRELYAKNSVRGALLDAHRTCFREIASKY